MTNTRCERLGQIEIGIIEHEGREYVALGSSVVGREITGYTKEDRNGITLTTWCGKTILDCRCEIVEQYWTGSLALMFRLPRSRFIIGYALGENGMLFRGELLDDCSDDDARRQAIHIAQYFSELDAEDEEAFQAESTET
ncbi:MAG: hypothetical protein CME33_13925 [Gimesia sp.]|uniref:hypothetical protein n=1 Tax=Gimesia sp. TaxID=2024833 RepID=UPI000C5F790E|nr:hypothetical protein [Gimesia sp.]MAX37651.1 hypothetical protein [Gimesia sp.]|tara:strand:+ start:14654 stop:15073 length:420 start_codon:yes stop_codon:yes gene_type:complete